jgi:putative multiple sugar transport system permease protein
MSRRHSLSGINTSRVVVLLLREHGRSCRRRWSHFRGPPEQRNAPWPAPGFELDVIAAVFIGGASASGGVGKVVGVVIGAFIMGVLNNGMSIMGIGVDYQQVIKGAVLLAAVFVDVYQKNKASA